MSLRQGTTCDAPGLRNHVGWQNDVVATRAALACRKSTCLISTCFDARHGQALSVDACRTTRPLVHVLSGLLSNRDMSDSRRDDSSRVDNCRGDVLEVRMSTVEACLISTSATRDMRNRRCASIGVDVDLGVAHQQSRHTHVYFSQSRWTLSQGVAFAARQPF